MQKREEIMKIEAEIHIKGMNLNKVKREKKNNRNCQKDTQTYI